MVELSALEIAWLQTNYEESKEKSLDGKADLVELAERFSGLVGKSINNREMVNLLKRAGCVGINNERRVEELMEEVRLNYEDGLRPIGLRPKDGFQPR